MDMENKMLLETQSLGEVSYRRLRLMGARWRAPLDSEADEDRGASGEDFEPRLLDLSGVICVGAAFGGPVALASASLFRRIYATTVVEADERPRIVISSTSGEVLGVISWENRPQVLSMGWSKSDSLVVVCADGRILVFSLQGGLLSSSSVFGKSEKSRLSDAVVFEGGVVALSFDETRIWVVEEPGALAEPQATAAALAKSYSFSTSLSSASSSSPLSQVTSMAVMQASDGSVRVLLATRTGTVLVCSTMGVSDQHLQEKIPARITRMAVAPNRRFVACYRDDGWLTVLSTNFESRVLDFDLNTQNPPLDMVWCGEDSIVMHWRGYLLNIGPYGDYLRYRYKKDGTPIPVKLVADFDCCRILTPSAVEMLQRVPEAIETVKRIGSTDPAAMLYDAMERFEAGDPGADENIRGLEDGAGLVDAVRSCVEAALGEVDPAEQKNLLKAAAYGKNFCSNFDPDDLVLACRRLRLLNQLRSEKVAMPLTFPQYELLAAPVVVHRLAARGLHAVALEACDLLELPDAKSAVLVHWACEKVRSSQSIAVPDEELAALVAQRLGIRRSGRVKNNGIPQKGYSTPPSALKIRPSISEVAAAASAAGRRSLAVKLLELEPLASERVPLLLNLGEHVQALDSAVRAGDVDLILLCLMYAERQGSVESGALSPRTAENRTSPGQQKFHELALAFPEATQILKAILKQRMDAGVGKRGQDQISFLSICRLQGGPLAEAEAAELLVKEAFALERKEARIGSLRSAQLLFQKSRENAFSAKMVEESVELFSVQEDLEQKTGRQDEFVNKSLTETIHSIISLAALPPDELNRSRSGGDNLTPDWCHNEAAQIAKRFGVSEKRLWRIRIKAMGASNQWEQLRRLAGTRTRPPVGYAPFAQAAIVGQRPADEIFWYTDKVQDPEKRFDLFAKAGANGVHSGWTRAFDVASGLKDLRRLHLVRLNCGDTALIARIDELQSRWLA